MAEEAVEEEVEELLHLHEDTASDETDFRWALLVGILAVSLTIAIGDQLESRHMHRIPEAAVGVLLAAVASRTTPKFRAWPTPSNGQKPNAQKKAVSRAGIGVRISPRWLSCSV